MDESMFQSEWKRGSGALRRFAHSWARDADELEELVQLTWALAWEKRDTYRGDGDFVGWLVALGRTVCTRDRARRRRECAAPISDALPDHADAPHVSEQRAHARDERDDLLLNIIMKLAPRQRAVIIAHHEFGCTVKDIAGMIGRSPETVKATLSQARRRLRQLESESEGAGGGTNPFDDEGSL